MVIFYGYVKILMGVPPTFDLSNFRIFHLTEV